jgi:hypothetical protein
MKRSLLVLTAAAVALSPVAASAAPAKATKRTITFDYSGFSTIDSPAVLVNFSGVLPVCAAANSCFDFDTVKGEKTIEVVASSPNVGIQIWFDNTYAGNVEAFCGKGKIAVSPRTAHTISVRTSMGTCGGLPTSGKLTATITGTK